MSFKNSCVIHRHLLSLFYLQTNHGLILTAYFLILLIFICRKIACSHMLLLGINLFAYKVLRMQLGVYFDSCLRNVDETVGFGFDTVVLHVL